MPERVRSIAEDSHGRFWVATYAEGAPALIFDSAGKYYRTLTLPKSADTARTIPIVVRRGIADSMYVFDGGHFSLTVFSPSGAVARSVPLKVDGVSDLAALQDGTIAFSAIIPTPEAAGYPLHIFSPNGAYKRSFGADVAVYRADAAFLIDRRITPAKRSGLFWSVRTARYTIELLDVFGRPQLSFDRKAPWFTVDDTWRHPARSQRQPAQVTSVFEDGAGRLWITSLVPDTTWREVVSDWTGADGKSAWKIASYDKYFDTVLEVIDPVLRSVIASRRFDECLPYLIDDRYLASSGTRKNGVPSVDLWRVDLLNQSSGGKR